GRCHIRCPGAATAGMYGNTRLAQRAARPSPTRRGVLANESPCGTPRAPVRDSSWTHPATHCPEIGLNPPAEVFDVCCGDPAVGRKLSQYAYRPLWLSFSGLTERA